MDEASPAPPRNTPTSKRLKDVAAASANAIRHEMQGERETGAGTRFMVDPAQVEAILQDWPKAPRTAAQDTLGRYGPPNEATPTKLFWYDRGPWKRILVTRDVVAHHFPMPHADFITCVIDYKVPPGRFNDIALFDGSCLLDRTAGEAAARCDSEWANILTLNLMHDIVQGRKTVEQARETFGQTSAAYILGRSAPYAESLQFTPPATATEDVDESVIGGPMLDQLKEKMKDLVGGRPSRSGGRTH